MKLKNYISGQWIEGNGHEIPLYNAVNGELVAISDTSGLDFEEALHFGRTIGYKNLSSMTFYDRGEMLKKIALYLLERKKKYYDECFSLPMYSSLSNEEQEYVIKTLFEILK